MVDGYLNFNTEVDTSGFNRGTNEISKQANKTGGILKTALGTAIGFSVAQLATKVVSSLIGVGNQAIELASDITEVQNVVDVAFGSMAYKCEEFADTAIEQFGMSKLSAKQTASTYMSMAKSMGLTMGAASDMAIETAKLTGDVASFYNISTDLAAVKLKSIFTGETETLKDLGVVMTEVNLQQFAMQQGIKKSYSDMNQAEKVALRYQFVMNSLKDAQGDFARTSDSWANQTRVLSERWKELLSIIGGGLIRVFTPVIRVINQVLSSLITLANAFATIMGKIFGFNKEIGSTKTGTAGVAESTEAAAGAQDDLADSTKKAGKEAKKSIAAFDKLDVLADNSSSGAGAGGGGGADFGEIGDIMPLEEASEKLNEQYQALIDKVNELKDAFAKGWSMGIGDLSAIDSIKDNLSSIGQSLKEIFTDPEMVSAADNYLNSLATSIGAIAGSFASIGLTIASNITGGMAQYLDTNKEFIKTKLVNILDAKTEIAQKVGELSATIAEIFTVFRSPEAQQITADIIEIFSNSFLETAEIITKFAADVVNTIADPIIKNKDKISTAISNTLAPVETVFTALATLVTNTAISISTAYDTYIAPAFDAISNGISTILAAVLDAYNTHLAPVMQSVADGISTIMNDYLQPLIDEIISLVGEVISGAASIWDETLSPLFAWLIDTFFKSVSDAITALWPTIETVIKSALTILKSLTTALKGLIEFITGVFTGDWEKAWNGIKDFFSGIWDSVKGVLNGVTEFVKTTFKTAWDTAWTGVKTVFKDTWNGIVGIVEKAVNKIIDGVNWCINQLNKIHVDVPDWVEDLTGMTGFGFSIPNLNHVTIPKLASGAVIPPNGEFLAMLGDQKSGRNLEAPESLIRQIVREESGGGDIVIKATGTMGQLIRLLKLEVDKENSRVGKSFAKGGAY